MGWRFVLHSQLSFNRSGAVAHQNKLLLRQGEKDMACGHHCVLMALMLLGVISRDALYEDVPDERLMETCARGQARYFTGCATTHLKEQLAPFSDQVRCRHLQRDVEVR